MTQFVWTFPTSSDRITELMGKCKLVFPLISAVCVCLLHGAVLAAETNPLTFSPPEVCRGGSFQINLVPKPKEGVTPTFVHIYHDGQLVNPAPKADGFSVEVPADLPLGTYQV